MKTLSLFSGAGFADDGFARAGMEIVAQCEIDPELRSFLDEFYPHTIKFGDIRDLRGGDLQFGPIEAIVGGFPCRGRGIDGTRSGLWSEYARLVGELRPRYVVVENVAALLQRGLGRVLADLSSLGYDAEWDVVPASVFGAPCHRERVFVVAYPNGEHHKAVIDWSLAATTVHTDPIWPALRGIESRASVYSHLASVDAAHRRDTSEPLLVCADAWDPAWTCAAQALGNAVSPVQTEFIGRCVMEAARRARR